MKIDIMIVRAVISLLIFLTVWVINVITKKNNGALLFSVIYLCISFALRVRLDINYADNVTSITIAIPFITSLVILTILECILVVRYEIDRNFMKVYTAINIIIIFAANHIIAAVFGITIA